MGSRAATLAADTALLQIVDAALAEAARRSGPWLVCRPGCTQCCIGPFAINALDADRLRLGLAELEARDPARASRVRQRARLSVERMQVDFPGDPLTGMLAGGEDAEAVFADFHNDEPCPALDPCAGTCDLYSWRPMTCRVFGPPVRVGDQALGVCELCFQGAADEEIAACEVDADPDRIEASLLRDFEEGTHPRLVAFCLAL